MTKVSIFILVFSTFILLSPTSYAESIAIEREIVEVKEEELLDLALEEKFESLVDMMGKLVSNNIDYRLEKEIISIVEFIYTDEDLIRIYYRIN